LEENRLIKQSVALEAQGSAGFGQCESRIDTANQPKRLAPRSPKQDCAKQAV
jgi:hypothetical protein